MNNEIRMTQHSPTNIKSRWDYAFKWKNNLRPSRFYNGTQ